MAVLKIHHITKNPDRFLGLLDQLTTHVPILRDSELQRQSIVFDLITTPESFFNIGRPILTISREKAFDLLAQRGYDVYITPSPEVRDLAEHYRARLLREGENRNLPFRVTNREKLAHLRAAVEEIIMKCGSRERLQRARQAEKGGSDYIEVTARVPRSYALLLRRLDAELGAGNETQRERGEETEQVKVEV